MQQSLQNVGTHIPNKLHGLTCQTTVNVIPYLYTSHLLKNPMKSWLGIILSPFSMKMWMLVSRRQTGKNIRWAIGA
jgi:hypothetical protein